MFSIELVIQASVCAALEDFFLRRTPLFPSFLPLIFWHHDGDVCPRWPTHQNNKRSGSLFQTKTSNSLLPKGKDVDEDLPERICPPHCPPKAVSAPCRQREMSIKRGHEVCWKGHPVVVTSAIVLLSWMEKTIRCVQLTSLWTNSPFRYILRGRFRRPDATLRLFVRQSSEAWSSSEDVTA